MSSLRSISVRSGCAMPAAKAKQTQGQSARRSALSCGCAIGSTRPRLGAALGFFKNIENRKHPLRRAKVLITTALGGWGRSPPVFALQRPLPALCRLSRHSRARLPPAAPPGGLRSQSASGSTAPEQRLRAVFKTLEYRTHRLRRASSRRVVSGSGVSAQREGRVGGAQPLGACAEGAMFWPLGALLKLYFDITL
jgi:hypothetical protein